MNMQKRFISMAAWCDLAKDGAAMPVTICLEGDSMRPLIRRGRDPVTIVPLQRPIKKGDVVLFTLGGGRYVVHRVRRLREKDVQTLGDNCLNPEPWFPLNQVLGQVVRVSRDGKTFRLDTPAARGLGRAWMAIFPLRRVMMRMRSLAGRCYRRMFPRKGCDSDGE